DVVTTGLIGTDRRPVPDQLPSTWGSDFAQGADPAHAILMLAARHRAYTRAGGLLPACPPGEVGPPHRDPVAGRAAHEILARLLFPPQLELLNLWLAAAAQRGEQASAAYWTSLAALAARTSEVERWALAKAVGERGVWFIEQNPQWARLARSLRSHLQHASPPEQHVPTVAVDQAAVRADPELIMAAARPWSKQLTWTVLEIIGSGQLQQRGVGYAGRVGARLPLPHYDLLRPAIQQIAIGVESLTPARLRSAREALLTLERTVWFRIEMGSAFSGEPIMVQRLEIPPW
ncbi:MAG TPA: hypothetical protein VJN19_09370, partial [Propionibacteriaceae bacterium]|nr:hypothetical protein [Propionibacteriaceae bacterium]